MSLVWTDEVVGQDEAFLNLEFLGLCMVFLMIKLSNPSIKQRKVLP